MAIDFERDARKPTPQQAEKPRPARARHVPVRGIQLAAQTLEQSSTANETESGIVSAARDGFVGGFTGNVGDSLGPASPIGALLQAGESIEEGFTPQAGVEDRLARFPELRDVEVPTGAAARFPELNETPAPPRVPEAEQDEGLTR